MTEIPGILSHYGCQFAAFTSPGLAAGVAGVCSSSEYLEMIGSTFIMWLIVLGFHGGELHIFSYPEY